MTCRVCGADMEERVTDLPFKLGDRSIVIIRGLPVLQCPCCNEYLLRDEVMAEVERMLGGADREAELEIFRFAA